jgi:GT2 family glycosyltransferase
MLDLAVVIVTWNVRDLALDALRTLYADLDNSGLSAQVIVVDSASSDGTSAAIAEQFPQARVIACDENVGFVRGNNLALRELGFERAGAPLPRAVYLLNPDTQTEAGATRALFGALMAEPNVGLVGARLSYDDGSFQDSAFAFPGLKQLWVEFFPTPGRLIVGTFNGRYPRALYDGRQPFAVDFVLGATMMLRSEALQQVGLLDEGIFMYTEEVDLAWRLHDAGWLVRCVPAAHVVHLSGQSTGQAKPQSAINLWTSRLRLFGKHYPAWKAWLARRVIVVGMRRKIRQAQSLPSPDREAMITAYQRIIELARS